jgi:hypothetical protein
MKIDDSGPFALALPMERYETFLAFIGSVFAPLYAVISPNPTPLGATIPVMAVVSLMYCLLRIGGSKWKAFRTSKA